MNRVAWLSLLLLVAGRAESAATGAADTASLRSKPALLRLSYEVLELDSAASLRNETLGLAGVHYLVNVHPDWYLGASAFGALQGERGGFFTGGFTLGTGRRFASKWSVDTALFVGGGGGGSAPQGGGLMLRPHLAISRDVGGMVLGAGVSHVRFPNGDIDSTQLNLNLGIPFDIYYGRARDIGKTVESGDLFGLALKKSEWIVAVGEYRPADNAKTTTGQAMTTPLKRVGFEYRQYVDVRRYYFIEAAGASGGESDGYAELLAGVGYRLPLLSPRLHLGAGLALGGAGGGRADTGGGLVAKARLGLDYDITQALKLGLEAGRIEGAGSFSANFAGLHLGYRLGEIATGRSGQTWQTGANVRLAPWRLAAVQHTSLDAARKNGQRQTLSLVGFKIEKFLSPRVYLTGQAHGAYTGDAGGYAVGLVGAGWETPLRKDGRLSFNAELTAGAAGGGGVDVGGGAIVQPQLGLTWRVNDQLAARLEAGKVHALDGALDSTVIGLGLQFEFSRPEYYP